MLLLAALAPRHHLTFYNILSLESFILINAWQSVKSAFDTAERYFKFTPCSNDAKWPGWITKLQASLSYSEETTEKAMFLRVDFLLKTWVKGGGMHAVEYKNKVDSASTDGYGIRTSAGNYLIQLCCHGNAYFIANRFFGH